MRILNLHKEFGIGIYIISIAILLVLTIIVHSLMDLKKEKKKKRIIEEGTKPKNRKKTGEKEQKHLFKIRNKEKIRLRLSMAGNPLSGFGLNEYNYHIFKIGFAIISLLSVLDEEPLNMITFTLFGYFVLDLYLLAKTRRIKKEIKEKYLTTLILGTIEGIKYGQSPAEFMLDIRKKLPEDSPLYRETGIMISKMRSGIFDDAIVEFMNRLQMPEIDIYSYSLMQYELGGKATKMLTMQLELIETRKNNKKQRETQAKQSLTSIASVLVVVCVVIMILFPLLASFRKLPM